MFATITHLGPMAGPFLGGPGWLFLLVPLFWLAVIAVVVALVGRRMRRARLAGYGPHAWSAGRSAERTLAERFAQGDVDEQEYRARLEVLRANAGPGPYGTV